MFVVVVLACIVGGGVFVVVVLACIVGGEECS